MIDRWCSEVGQRYLEEVELPSRDPEEVELPSRDPEEVELPSRDPEEVELPSREPEGEKAEVPQQPLHMLLRGAQGRRTRLRRQKVPARLQRPLEWPQPPPPMPECLEPWPLEELELPLPEWPPSPSVVPEGLSAVPEGSSSPPVIPECLPAVREEFLFPPPPAEGEELLFQPPPPEGDGPPFLSPPREVPPSLLLLEGPGSLPAFMGFEGPGPPLLKKAWGSRHQHRPPPPVEIAHPMDIRGLLGGGLGFKGGEFGRLRPPYFVRGGRYVAEQGSALRNTGREGVKFLPARKTCENVAGALIE
ncbi:UNVERIFIED_CONTAM: hypothetical protein FKN15_054105 [Acipenser sinensis]